MENGPQQGGANFSAPVGSIGGGVTGRDQIGTQINYNQTPPAPNAAARLRCNIEQRRQLFIARVDWLQRLQAALGAPGAYAAIVLRGAPGVGKSEIAREYARRCANHYPGGRFFLKGGDTGFTTDLAAIGKIHCGPLPADLDLKGQAASALSHLGSAPTLLIYDNVPDDTALAEILPCDGALCHVILTTTFDGVWAGWQKLEIPTLTDTESLEIVAQLAGPQVVARFGRQLVDRAGGLPVQLVPNCLSLAQEARRGRLHQVPTTLSADSLTSFRGPYQRLDEPARLLLHCAAQLNPQRILADALQDQMQAALGWQKPEFDRALDACRDLTLLEGNAELRMHQLFAMFLLENPPAAGLVEALAKVGRVQATSLIDMARELAAHPNRADLASKLAGFSLDPAQWAACRIDISATDGASIGSALFETGAFAAAQQWYERAVEVHERPDADGRVDHESLGNSMHNVGACLSRAGQFDAARPWYERSVAATKKGDVHGRVNHASLGTSLHQVGYCLSRTGQFDTALPWYERAVAAAEKGDVHGRINHESLGTSLHQLGYCLSSTGQFDTALPWYERAVAAAEKGDVHGRINHESLGTSLHQLGHCLSSTSQFDAARPWFERAVAAAEKGDVHGRVDHESLGKSLHQVGNCLSSTSQFDAARPWYERAVAAKEQGDVHGRVDHASLGTSLHQVGHCLSSTGRFDAAIPWFERAVAAAEKGDVHGRIDHESLGISLHEVGYCLSSTSRFDAAIPWFERAVAAAEKGDVHGRVDHESLGTSLQQVGYCLSSTGQFDAAIPWYERAVVAQEQGDIFGRIDQASLRTSLEEVAWCRKQTRQEKAAGA